MNRVRIQQRPRTTTLRTTHHLTHFPAQALDPRVWSFFCPRAILRIVHLFAAAAADGVYFWQKRSRPTEGDSEPRQAKPVCIQCVCDPFHDRAYCPPPPARADCVSRVQEDQVRLVLSEIVELDTATNNIYMCVSPNCRAHTGAQAQAHTHTLAHTRTHTHTHTHTLTHRHTHRHPPTHTHTRMHTHAHTGTHTGTHTHTGTQARTHTHTHTHTHKHASTHMHMHTQRQSPQAVFLACMYAAQVRAGPARGGRG